MHETKTSYDEGYDRTKLNIYRAIDGDGSIEMRSVYELLESIGLVDLKIYGHPRFNCIYGLAENFLAPSEKFSVTALSR